MQKRKKVFVALRMAMSSGREKLLGITRYLSDGHDWDVRLVEETALFTPSAVRAALADGVDGFIIALRDSFHALDPLMKKQLPTVICNLYDHPLRERTRNLVSISNDAKVIGQAAADHFLSQGRFRSYAYAQTPSDERWSRTRGKSFELALAKHGQSTVFLDMTKRDSVLAQLRELPQPVAVFAANDNVASEVLGLSRAARIRVPERCAILGTDDNEQICLTAKPHLSSVQPDFEQEGYLAAQELDRMMNARGETPVRAIRTGIKGLSVRASSVSKVNYGRIVTRALDYIHDNATKGIGVDDVARHLRVSRRLLYLRFSESGSPSVRTLIEGRQMDEAKRLLRTTRLSLAAVAKACGYANANVFRNAFRRRFGFPVGRFRGHKPLSNSSQAPSADFSSG